MRVSMKKIRDVLRLTHELKLSVRQISEATGVGKTAVGEYVSRAKVLGITSCGGALRHDAGAAGDRRRRVGAAAVRAGRLSRWNRARRAQLGQGARGR